MPLLVGQLQARDPSPHRQAVSVRVPRSLGKVTFAAVHPSTHELSVWTATCIRPKTGDRDSGDQGEAAGVNTVIDITASHCPHPGSARTTAPGGRYYDRKISEGKTHNAAMRYLKRQIASRVRWLMITNERHQPNTDKVSTARDLTCTEAPVSSTVAGV